MSTLAIQIISAINVIPKDESKGCNSFCIVRFGGAELFRTELCEGTTDPVWQHAETKAVTVFKGKEKEHNRSCFLERIEVEIYNVDRNNKAELVGMTKLHLFNTGPPGWYSLLDPTQPHRDLRCRVLIGLTLLEEEGSSDGRILGFLKLGEVLPFEDHHHLYMDFNWAAHGAIGSPLLPVLEAGEVVMDKRDKVQWDISMGSNVFGDRHRVTCRGSLVLTDIRVLFVPTEATYPDWMQLSFGGDNDEESPSEYTEEQKLFIRRLTYVMPIPGLQDVKVAAGTGSDAANNASMTFFGKDGSAIEFHIRKQKPSKMTSYAVYRAGLRTDEVAPLLWCNRVAEEIQWQLKEGKTWVRFAKYLRTECESKLSAISSSFMSISDVSQMVDVGADFCRMNASSAWDWDASTLNGQYKLCTTYPQSLYFPKSMSENDVQLAAKVRSRNRLAALSWIHPGNGAPLTRAAQPKTGIATQSEDDRRMLLAIAGTSSRPTPKPLRIIDARPFINAQANALRGKGYENVNYLGGPSVAALAFMDIHNIHVMRDSLLRLKEESSVSNVWASGSSSAGGASEHPAAGKATTSGGAASSANTGGGATQTEKTYGAGGSVGDTTDGLHHSKWLHHISTVLRAAVTTADSLMSGHPILVHCSDGWDRTAQLTGLTAVMLDPFYRTIEGLFVIIEREFVSFGHQFEHRCGKTTHKETSPVFLQFLDCIYQLATQFPTKFEYSARMLALFAKLCYSGLFIGFNKNCERDVMKTLSQCCADGILENDDLPFTSIYTYVRVLLYSSVGDSLINTYYHPASGHSSAHASVDYIRPKYGVSDMVFWQDGVGNCAVSGLVHFHTGVPSMEECSVYMIGSNSRYLHYLQSHLQELPQSVVQTLEYIHNSHQHTLCPAAPYRRHHQLSRHDFRSFRSVSSPPMDEDVYGPMSVMSLLQTNSFLQSSAAMLATAGSFSGRAGGVGGRMMTGAAIRIQTWYRSIVMASRFCIMKNEYYCGDDPVVKELLKAGLGDVVERPSQNVQRLLRVFLLSELKHSTDRRRHKRQMSQTLVQSILCDVVDHALRLCIRAEMSDLRDSLIRKSRISAEDRSSGDHGHVGGGKMAFGAFSRLAGGFGSLLVGGKKIAEGLVDFSDDEGESGESETDDDDAGIGVLGAVSKGNQSAANPPHQDGGFASRMFKFGK